MFISKPFRPVASFVRLSFTFKDRSWQCKQLSNKIATSIQLLAVRDCRSTFLIAIPFLHPLVSHSAKYIM